MSLSKDTKERLKIALASEPAGKEVADAIENAGGSELTYVEEKWSGGFESVPYVVWPFGDGILDSLAALSLPSAGDWDINFSVTVTTSGSRVGNLHVIASTQSGDAAWDGPGEFGEADNYIAQGINSSGSQYMTISGTFRYVAGAPIDMHLNAELDGPGFANIQLAGYKISARKMG